MIRISVPATSANIGSGFDCSGLALGMHNVVHMDENDRIDISSLSGIEIPRDENNMICAAAMEVYRLCGKRFDGITIKEENTIPIARGLGSSAACVAAGVSGANELLGSPLSRSDVLNVCARIEGHPDNAAPAILGGFTVSVITGTDVLSIRYEIDEELDFMTFIPDFKLKTSLARASIPEKIPHVDARFNLSRSALLVAAFAEKKYELLHEATKDRLHQPYRFGLIKGSEKIISASEQLGALASFISGAGSSMMAIVKKTNSDFEHNMNKLLAADEEMSHFKLVKLAADNVGTTIERE